MDTEPPPGDDPNIAVRFVLSLFVRAWDGSSTAQAMLLLLVGACSIMGIIAANGVSRRQRKRRVFSPVATMNPLPTPSPHTETGTHRM
jgi:hypothetical protein